ncbi:hypothetical protein FCE95_15610 [Luteimonas gilva]|uniref:Lipoprotein n=1 Tax=Luteimonas gilva TaxID=2572684 RepID=A0A4U5JMQ2_9GAMM|nr:hypothetical protein [Luteimonas gilva]TKR29558.1 hypothetical protein FCE95_15610 [Luteimonas gilva]
MNKLLCAAAAAMLLSACDKPAPSAPAASDAPAPVAAPAEPANAPVATESAPPAVETAPAAPAAEVAEADPAADKATDASIDKLLGDHTRYRDAIDRFQKAVAAKDAAGVAALVAYPFEADIDGRKTKIKDAAGFAAQYGKIVTPPIAEAIVKQKYSEMFVNVQGVMFGDGEAWMNGICKDDACKNFDVKVIRIQPAGEKSEETSK